MIPFCSSTYSRSCRSALPLTIHEEEKKIFFTFVREQMIMQNHQRKKKEKIMSSSSNIQIIHQHTPMKANHI